MDCTSILELLQSLAEIYDGCEFIPEPDSDEVE